MSLQVWLPMNGNLVNQGLCTDTIMNNGATSVAAGKMGSCYSFDGVFRVDGAYEALATNFCEY